MLIPIMAILNNALAIWRNATDPNMKDKAFNVALKKDWHKALNIAEDIMEITDEYVSEHTNRKTFLKKYTRLKKQFNKLD